MQRIIMLALTLLAMTYSKAQIVQPINPEITKNTIFVSVSEHTDVDPIINNELIKISSNRTLSYVGLDGKYVYGANAKLRAGGAGFDKSRGRFSGGIAMVARDNVENSIIYTNQKYVDLPATYTKVSGFCDGIAMAEKPSGFKKASCYINEQGKEVFPSLSVVYSYYSGNFKVSELSEGLRAFLDPTEGLWGYADEKGKIIIKPQFVNALPFSDGLAAVAVKIEWSEKWGFIDKQGNMQIPATYRKYPGSFSEGLAVVRTEDSKMAYIDKTGKIVSPEYYECNGFKDGYAFVNIQYGKTAVIDRDFKQVKTFGDKESFEIPHEDADNIWGMRFYGGYTAVRPSGQPGLLLNPQGDIAYRANDHYSVFGNFYDNTHAMATIRLGTNSYTGFINKAGEFIILFVPIGTTLSPPLVHETFVAREIGEPNPPTQGIGDLTGPGRKGGTAPETKKYKLLLAVNPEEAGEALEPGDYLENSQVMLRTNGTFPNKHKYSFVGWQDEQGREISTSASFQYLMPASNTKVTAVYKENPKYELTVEAENPEGGTLSGGGEYYERESFEITATPGEGYKFDGWYKSDEPYSKSAQLTHTMPGEDLLLRARFSEIVAGEEYIPVLFLSSTHSDAKLTGAGTYKAGTEVAVSTTIPAGYKFDGWYGAFDRKKISTPSFVWKMGNQSQHFVAVFTKLDDNKRDPEKGDRQGVSDTLITQRKPNSEGLLVQPFDKPLYFAGSYNIQLSSQSVAHFANSAGPLKVPATAYMEIHPGFDMPTLYTGKVKGVIYFDIDPIPVPDDLKKVSEYMEYNETMEDTVSIYFSPMFIYRITDKYIYAMGEGFAGADRKKTNMKPMGFIYRFEYSTTVDNAIVLGKYEIYRHTVVRIDGLPKNKYEWVNPGIVDKPDNIYKSEPAKENRYNGCTLYPVDNSMVIPWMAKPEMLKLLDASLVHPKAVNINIKSWSQMILMVIRDEYEILYNQLRNYEQTDTVTGTPFPVF